MYDFDDIKKHGAKIKISFSVKSHIYQQMRFISTLQITKIYVKTYIKTAPTCFGLRPSPGSLRPDDGRSCNVNFSDL